MMASTNSLPTNNSNDFSKLTEISCFLVNANRIPRPNSALSSNNEFAQAGPLPISFFL